MKFIATALLSLLATAFASPSYDGHSVYRVVPSTASQVSQLKLLKQARGNQLDWWIEPTIVGRFSDVRVSGAIESEIVNYLESTGATYTKIIDDVQDKIEAVNTKNNILLGAGASWDSAYHNYDDTVAWLQSLEQTYPNLATVQEAGRSYENRTIYAITITGPGDASNRPTIALDGGIHAREWIAPATVDYIVGQLLSLYSSSSSIKSLVDNIVWTVVPIFNVDGYQYTFDTDRLWRKTRSPNKLSLCVGTDPCRNSPIGWGLPGSSSSPCADDYHGPKAQSEIEVQTLLKFYSQLPNLRAYINFHSYSQLWMGPYGYQAAFPPTADYNYQQSVASSATDALTAVHGTQYTYGPAYTTIYAASGIPADTLYVSYNVTLAFSVELRDTGAEGFLLDPSQIVPCGEEVWAGVQVLAKAVLDA